MNYIAKMSGSVPSLYDLAEAYDIAFDFRNVAAECDTMDVICQQHRGSAPASFLDIACGPGYHCLEYASRGRRAIGLDVNNTMLEYAALKAKSRGVKVDFVRADMRDFNLEACVDLAFCGMSSFHYLLTSADILAHLRCVARALSKGGIYVVEASHPRDTFGVGQSLKHEWTSQRGDTTVHSAWGLPDDQFDTLTQVRRTTVRLSVETPNNSEQHEFASVKREITYQELQLLVDASGLFEPVAWLGAIDPNVPLTNDKSSFKMVAVLRKL